MALPFANLGPVALQAFGRPAAISVESPTGPGTIVAGQFVPAATATQTITAAVQPTSQKDLQLFPEGDRDKETITVYAIALLQASSVDGQRPADIVVWNSKRWMVAMAEDWTQQAGYCKAFCRRVDGS